MELSQPNFNAVIDFGNTFGKVGLFDGNQLVLSKSQLEEKDVLLFIEEHSPQRVIISNVGASKEQLLQKLSQQCRTLEFTHETYVPITNQYSTPKTLGLDRLAAVVGAKVFFPHDHCLVIDMGTCITYDFITSEAQYLGGGISPGMKMRCKALHDYTAKLPLVEPVASVPLIGDSTNSSILSGVVNGIAAEMNGIIEKYTDKFESIRVLLCGGDANFFESSLKPHIFANRDLVLHGLSRILQANEEDI
ncbi:type III pantothenate kinase [Limibacter armeniacum]|uniref:type III pantothenate kinase n=1 Tax=Limibacter armeniacum TaxID=466084 RepID=UPI002FE52EE9